MSRDTILLLIGAGIALASSIVTALIQHFLSLRAERIKRAWEKEERQSQEFKKNLTEGTQLDRETLKKVIDEAIKLGKRPNLLLAASPSKELQIILEALKREDLAEVEKQEEKDR